MTFAYQEIRPRKAVDMVVYNRSYEVGDDPEDSCFGTTYFECVVMSSLHNLGRDLDSLEARVCRPDIKTCSRGGPKV